MRLPLRCVLPVARYNFVASYRLQQHPQLCGKGSGGGFGVFLLVYLFLILTQRYIFIDFERERNIDVIEKHPSVASHSHPDQELNPKSSYMCPDWELM